MTPRNEEETDPIERFGEIAPMPADHKPIPEPEDDR